MFIEGSHRNRKDKEIDEDTLIMYALDAGADDIKDEGEVFEDNRANEFSEQGSIWRKTVWLYPDVEMLPKIMQAKRRRVK